MIDPTQDDVGRKVIYRDLGARKIEEGVITSFNDHYVFVRYGENVQSQATERHTLEWSFRRPSQTAVIATLGGGGCTAIDFCDPPLDPS